jgi:hypothetical protein
MNILQIAEEEGALVRFSDSSGDYDNAVALERFAARIRAEQKETILEVLNPRCWTLEMSEAWNKNIPDVNAAFEALREIAIRNASPDSDKCEINVYSSRMCEFGTKSCTKKHTSPESDIDQLTRLT